jgi:hypothetical protein
MGDAVEASAERVRDHLRRPISSRRNLLTKTAGNTVNEIVPKIIAGVVTGSPALLSEAAHVTIGGVAPRGRPI